MKRIAVKKLDPGRRIDGDLPLLDLERGFPAGLLHVHRFRDRQQRAPVGPAAVVEVLRDLGLPRRQRLGVVGGPAQDLPPQAGKGLVVEMVEIRDPLAGELRLHVDRERAAQRGVGQLVALHAEHLGGEGRERFPARGCRDGNG